MIRKDKIHIVLLVCAVILCLAANGSVSSDELGQMHSSLAGTTALADGPPETETDEVSQEVNTAADPAESAEPDNYVPLYINDTFYNEQDVYWLSRIIYAESGNQPLAGQIGVGNVVLNRVDNSRFPDTVYEVIFDRTYGVQFSPVESGSIYAEPDEEAVVAAKLALEGYNTAGESLYFVNPDIGAGSWFASNLTYVTSIGDHDFYA